MKETLYKFSYKEKNGGYFSISSQPDNFYEITWELKGVIYSKWFLTGEYKYVSCKMWEFKLSFKDICEIYKLFNTWQEKLNIKSINSINWKAISISIKKINIKDCDKSFKKFLNDCNINKLYEFKYSEWYESFYWNIISNPYSYIMINKDKKDLKNLKKFIKEYPWLIEEEYMNLNKKSKITKKWKEAIIKLLNKWFYWKTIINKIINKEI